VSPAAPVVDDLVAAYGANLDLKALLRAVFLHPDFRSDQTRTGLVKQPIEWLVGALRAIAPQAMAPGAPDKVQAAVRAVLNELGQVPFDPPNVGGWPQNDYWLTTASALGRLRFAAGIVRLADLSAVDAQPVGSRPVFVARVLGVDGWGPSTGAALAGVSDVSSMLVTLALVSPEYVVN